MLCHIINLIWHHLSDLFRKYTTNTLSFCMNCHHYLCRYLMSKIKKNLKNINKSSIEIHLEGDLGTGKTFLSILIIELKIWEFSMAWWPFVIVNCWAWEIISCDLVVNRLRSIICYCLILNQQNLSQLLFNDIISVNSIITLWKSVILSFILLFF